ncbi:MAG: hypothetical protein WA865_05670 [Spirulinaceae cyanobacterium]
MKPTKQPETKIIIVIPAVKQPQPAKKPKIHPSILKAIAITTITLISWLNPEAAIAIALIRLFFILFQWLNQNKVKNILLKHQKLSHPSSLGL